MELIKVQYPELVPILSQPGVWDALVQAVENNYSPARLQAALQATPYYRDTPATDRAWFIRQSIDPATAQQDLQRAQAVLDRQIYSTGATLTGDQYQALLHGALVNSWSEQELRINVVATAGGFAGGEFSANANKILGLADDWGVPVSPDWATDQARKLTEGQVTAESLQGYMQEQAKSMYPGLTAAIDSGQTVRQYVEPYAQIAARELNINPNDFHLSDTKWAAPIQQVDPKSGQRTAMSLDAWQTKLRTDPQYGYDLTDNAKAQAASLVTTLGQKFGVLS